MIRFAPLLTAMMLGALPAHAAPEAEGSAVVYCYDEARQLVKRVRARHCDGQPVTPAQAQALHNRIEADRTARRYRTLNETATRERNGIRFKSAGAAFAVNPRGELLTSAHVIRGCDMLEVRNNASTKSYPARVKAVADKIDLAIIQIGKQTPDILRFSPQAPRDGAPLALIGYPSEGMIRRVPRMTPVLISHAVSNPDRYGLLGVAGDVRRGNSGGPALDSRGRAVGVLKAKINTVAAHKLTGRTLTNLGVVVERSRVLSFLEKSRTRYAIDGDQSAEKTGRDLFTQGSRAVFRVDCLVRK